MSAERLPKALFRDDGLPVWCRALHDAQDVLIAQIAGRVLCGDLGLDARATCEVLCAISEMGEAMPRPHSDPGWLRLFPLRRPGSVGLAVHALTGRPGEPERRTAAWTRRRVRRREHRSRLPVRLGLVTALGPGELRDRCEWVRRSESD